ncbi:MAG: methylated-DNA--[protein]-cysteine S-methyltransferase [Candidatus Krumholzibacteriota bacterium]|nr:methylated-DNA--[protein]-cysteine S-methyltransferase [Candidatus Krumholzibacteriota bacterium]
MDKKFYTFIESPVGTLYLEMTGNKLSGLRFASRKGKIDPGEGWKEASAPFKEVIRQLRTYFKGDLKKFDIPLLLEGTDFQRAAWKELRKIPYGKTITYGEQARRMGKPKASRATGGANRANPVAIIVPCHRVIGSNGRLTGFGGGLDVKDKLLSLENASGYRPE